MLAKLSHFYKKSSEHRTFSIEKEVKKTHLKRARLDDERVCVHAQHLQRRHGRTLFGRGRLAQAEPGVDIAGVRLVDHLGPTGRGFLVEKS